MSRVGKRSRASCEALEDRLLLNGTPDPMEGMSYVDVAVGPMLAGRPDDVVFKDFATLELTADPDAARATSGRPLPVAVRVDLKESAANLSVSARGTGVFASIRLDRTLPGPWDSRRPAILDVLAAPSGPGEGTLSIVTRALDGAGDLLASSRRDVFAWYEGTRTWVSASSPTDLKLTRLDALLAEGTISPEDHDAGVDAVVGSVGVGGETSLAEMGVSGGSSSAIASRLAALAATDVVVSGTALWKDSAGKTHGIPSATLEVHEKTAAGSTLLKSTTTDGQGKFNVTVTPTGSGGKADLFVRVFARSTIADVKPAGASAKTYFLDSPVKTGVTLGAPTTIDVTTATNTADSDTVFSVHSALVNIGGYAGTLAGSAPSPIVVRFPTTENTSKFKSGDKELHILQLDRWDWDVIHHEYGHYFANVNKVTDLIGGKHNFSDNLASTLGDKSKGIRLAWGEGWPTFFAISGQASTGASALNIPNVGNTRYQDTEDSTLDTDLETSTGKGEDNEVSVFATLWDLYDTNKDGDDTVSISDKTLYGLFASGKANTAGKAWEAIAATKDAKGKAEVGGVFGMNNIAPVPTAPADKFRISKAKDIPEFKWKKNGGGTPNPLNEFRLRFYSDDFKTLLLETKDLGDVDTYKPTADEWKTILTGRSSFKWVVLGKNKTTPATPGGALDFYWSKARSVSGTSIAFVIDDTGSMGEEIGGVRVALQNYIDVVRSKLGPDDRPPVIELITFKDNVTVRLVSDDLDAVKAAVGALRASGGGDCPEFSAQALAAAAEDISPGGTILLATDASSQPGVDAAAVIAQLKARGVTVNTILSGDCEGIDSPGGAPAPLALALASTSGEACDDDQGDDPIAPGPEFVASAPTNPVALAATTGASAKPGASGDDEDENPVAIDDPGQPPLDLFGDTPAAARLLPLGSQPVLGLLGDPLNRVDVFAVELKKEIRYAINVFLDPGSSVQLEVLGPDATTTLLSRSAFSDAEFAFTPETDGTYFVSVSQGFSSDPTNYRLSVQRNPLAGVTSAVDLFSTVSAETGGAFLVRDEVNRGDTGPYEAAILNVMLSTLGPAVLSSNPAIVPRGQTMSVALTGRGTNWRAGQTQVAFGGGGITVLSVDVRTATSLTVLVQVAPDATQGLRDVTVTTPVGTAVETAQGNRVLQVGAPVAGATLLSVEPNTLNQGRTLGLVIRGAGTAWDSTSVLTLGPGITVGSVTAESPTLIRASVTVASGAEIGFRSAEVVTGSNRDSLQRAVFLGSGGAIVPEIIGLTPASARRGVETEVSVTGSATNFVAGVTTASFGDGVTVLSVTVTSPTTAVVRILVAPDAPVGFLSPVLTTGAEAAVLINGFFVDLPQPQLVQVAPTSARRGQQVDVSLIGLGTTFTAGITTATFGAGITVQSLMVSGPTSAIARIVVAPDAALGPRDIVLTTGAETATLAGGFTVGASDVVSPTVVNVRREGVHFAPTRVLLTFSEPLDPVRASDVGNYRLFLVRPRGLLRPVAIRLASYDDATRTVTLAPAERLNFHARYEIRVVGLGITDLAGNPLAGNGAGVPGSNFLGILKGARLVSVPASAPAPTGSGLPRPTPIRRGPIPRAPRLPR